MVSGPGQVDGDPKVRKKPSDTQGSPSPVSKKNVTIKSENVSCQMMCLKKDPNFDIKRNLYPGNIGGGDSFLPSPHRCVFP